MDEPRPHDGELPSGAGLLGGSDLTARLEQWIADARSRDAAAARGRARWLRVQADESATFAGLLVDLAERGEPVLMQGRVGRRHRGVVAAVGADFCALRTAGGRDVLLTFSGISSIRPESRSSPATGDRAVQAEIGLAEVLALLVVDRPRVLIVTTAGDEGVVGELRSVGRDLVTVRLDGEPGGPVYVAVSAIAEVSLV